MRMKISTNKQKGCYKKKHKQGIVMLPGCAYIYIMRLESDPGQTSGDIRKGRLKIF